MAPPSKSWVVISDSQVDADSPLDTTLMTGLRDNQIHLEEWLGMSYTAAQDHDHDDTNSKAVVGVAAGSIDPASLSLASGSGTNTNLAAGSYYSMLLDRYSHIRQSYAKLQASAAITNQAKMILRPSSTQTLVDGYSVRNDEASAAIDISSNWGYHS